MSKFKKSLRNYAKALFINKNQIRPDKTAFSSKLEFNRKIILIFLLTLRRQKKKQDVVI